MTRTEYLLNPSFTAKRGTDLPNAKLDPVKVREIRANRKGQTSKQLADTFGVHFRTIEKVQSYDTWTHVK
jgi:hypothetical protein